MAFAFDLASAQFSHFRTVTPWTEYEAKLVSRVMSVRPFGVTVKRMARDFDGGGFAMWGLISGNSHAARVSVRREARQASPDMVDGRARVAHFAAWSRPANLSFHSKDV